MLRKILVLIFIALNSSGITAQDFSANWKGYFSFNTIAALSYGDGKVFAAAQNAVFTYDLDQNELEILSTVEGLSGEDISALFYSESTDLLFIGYASGLMDIVDPDKDVFTVVDISIRPAIPPSEKRINSFDEYEGFLYISTGFGISRYDLRRREFEDSYFIGNNGSRLNILQTAISGDYIYAASDTGGLRRALAAASNLIDFRNWSTIDAGSWLGIGAAGTNLYGIQADNTLQRIENTNFTTIDTYSSGPLKLTVRNELLSVTLFDQVLSYDSAGNRISVIGQIPEFPDSYNSAIALDGTVYLGTTTNGLLITPMNNTSGALQILPGGPLRNDPFGIEAAPGQLWVVYGDYSDTFNPFPLKQRGVSHLQKEAGWINLPFEELLGANSLVNITYNPENLEQVFMSSYNAGLLEIVEDVPVKLFDETNSGLSDLPVNPGDVRINGASYDRSGNFWMTNSLVENALARKSGDQIQGISIRSILPDFDQVNYSELVTGRLGNVYFGSANRGLLGYNPASGKFARIDAERSGLPSSRIQALAIDANGSLWIGTSLGLRVLFAPSQMFEDPELDVTPIIIEENGIAVELLNDQVIRKIVVDGSNNKWIGTVSSGVFYVSPNGQETLLRFNRTNSPLPSNNIQDITIDSETGEVFFATPRGLVSFAGSAVAPAVNLEAVRAYPNPVRPGFNGPVTIDGLTARANVKITDISGNLVYEEVSRGGSIQWDTTAFGRYKVASGVYLILVTGEDAAETQVRKIMIIR